MKKIFNVDQMSVMILAGAIMALAWGCKREAVNVVADRVIEDVSQTLADGIYRTDEFTEKAISDYINIYDDMELTPCIYQTNYVIGDICQGKYIVTNGVIEEVVEEETYVTATNIPDYSGYIEVYDDTRWSNDNRDGLARDWVCYLPMYWPDGTNGMCELGYRDDGVVVWRKAQ